MVRKLIRFLLVCILSSICFAQEYNPSEAKIKVIPLTDRITKLQCISGTYVNTLALAGEEGVLLVDTGYPQTGKVLKEEIKKIGIGKVRMVINTHEHNDHTAGNVRFADEAVIISHERVRTAYGGRYFALEPINRPGIPQVTFADELSIHFNDEEIRLKHYPNGHTPGDIVVFFPKSNLAFVGDMVFAGCFPGADLSRGGDLTGCLHNVQKLMDDYPPGTRFVNGHGPDYSADDLERYLEVGLTTQKLILDQIIDGKSVEEIAKSNVLDPWKEWCEGVISRQDWINNVYQQYLKEIGKQVPSICEPLTELIVQGNIQKAAEFYTHIRKMSPDQYNFNEDQLNILGYQLLNRSMVDEAITIFQMNVSAYPESGNVYDSLAEAYANKGETKQAVQYYLKSLEKDPNNGNASVMLKQLGYIPEK